MLSLRNPLVVLLFGLALFFCFYKAGKDDLLQSALIPSTKSFTSSPSQITRVKPRSSPPASKTEASDPMRDNLILTTQDGALFSFLFNKKALRSTDLPLITKRFEQPYSSMPWLEKKEVLSRLGFLKALTSFQTEEAHQLYRHILRNPHEHFMVRRQAFVNLRPQLSSRDLHRYYQELDSRVLALSYKSESEMIEETLLARFPR